MRLLTLLVLACGLTAAQARKIAPTQRVTATAQPKMAYKAPAAKAHSIRSSTPAKTVYRAQAPKSTRVTTQKVTRSRYRYVPTRPVVQQTPSLDRYREIQQALIDRGYLQAEADGRWDANCINALNRFKQDQNLKADGKLDSLSLIALGLGPKKSTYLPGSGGSEPAVSSTLAQ